MRGLPVKKTQLLSQTLKNVIWSLSRNRCCFLLRKSALHLPHAPEARCSNLTDFCSDAEQIRAKAHELHLHHLLCCLPCEGLAAKLFFLNRFPPHLPPPLALRPAVGLEGGALLRGSFSVGVGFGLPTACFLSSHGSDFSSLLVQVNNTSCCKYSGVIVWVTPRPSCGLAPG